MSRFTGDVIGLPCVRDAVAKVATAEINPYVILSIQGAHCSRVTVDFPDTKAVVFVAP